MALARFLFILSVFVAAYIAVMLPWLWLLCAVVVVGVPGQEGQLALRLRHGPMGADQRPVGHDRRRERPPRRRNSGLDPPPRIDEEPVRLDKVDFLSEDLTSQYEKYATKKKSR